MVANRQILSRRAPPDASPYRQGGLKSGLMLKAALILVVLCSHGSADRRMCRLERRTGRRAEAGRQAGQDRSGPSGVGSAHPRGRRHAGRRGPGHDLLRGRRRRSSRARRSWRSRRRRDRRSSRSIARSCNTTSTSSARRTRARSRSTARSDSGHLPRVEDTPDVRRAAAELAQAKQGFERASELHKRQLISQQMLDDADTTLRLKRRCL